MGIQGLRSFRLNDGLYLLASLAILIGLVLSIISLLRLCASACAESHFWLLFGFPFEYSGLLFFIVLLTIHTFARRKSICSSLCALLLAAGCGAELKFIFVQKYQIGTWCPICLAIASCVFIATLCYATDYIGKLNRQMKEKVEGELMKSITKGLAGLSVFVLGFLLATIGVSKFDPIQAQQDTLKDNLFFGNKTSPIEVYIFTDWACPACRQLETDLEKMAPTIMKIAKLTFVDDAIHTETLNYSPYNVSFMIKNKKDYFKLRQELTKLALEVETPTDQDVEKIAKKVGTTYQHLSFSDIALSQKYFKQLAKLFSVTKTPTMVIVNAQNKKGKRLIGIPEITEGNVIKAIDSLNNNKLPVKK